MTLALLSDVDTQYLLELDDIFNKYVPMLPQGSCRASAISGRGKAGLALVTVPTGGYSCRLLFREPARGEKGHDNFPLRNIFCSGSLGQSRENPKEPFSYQIYEFLTLAR